MPEDTIVESELPGIEFLPPPVTETPADPADRTSKPRGRPKGSVSKATLDSLREDLTQSLVEASAAMAMASPLAMAVLDERAERTAAAIVTLAGSSPRLLAALKKTVKARAVVTIGETMSAVSVAILVDWNRIEPDSVISKKLGVTDKFIEAYPERVTYVEETNGNRSHSRSGLFQ